MTKIIVSMWTTLDGYVAGSDGSMDWLRADSDLNDYETRLVDNAGALLLGRVTYTDFAGYWPAVARGEIAADEASRRYAHRLDQLEKFVASRTLAAATWPTTRTIRDVTRAEVARVKESVDGDIIVYGSLTLIEALSRLALIDEIHVIVHPVLLGQGRPIVASDQRIDDVQLLCCEPFSSGAVLMRYAAT